MCTQKKVLYGIVAFGLVGALGCGGPDESQSVDGATALSFALINSTADITGPLRYIVESQNEVLLEGTLSGESNGDCLDFERHVVDAGMINIHAWTDSGLVWYLPLRLEEGSCVEVAVDFTTTTSTIQAFGIGEESFLPVRVHFGGEYVGLVGKVMSRERAEEFGELWKQVRHPDDFNLSRKWLVEQIREGLVVWVAPEPEREYRLHLFYGDGRSFYSPKVYSYDSAWEIVAFDWKIEEAFE